MGEFTFSEQAIKGIISLVFIFLAFIMMMNVFLHNKVTNWAVTLPEKLLFSGLLFTSVIAMIFIDYLSFNNNPYSFISFIFIIILMIINGLYQYQSSNLILLVFIILFRLLYINNVTIDVVILTSIKYLFLYVTIMISNKLIQHQKTRVLTIFGLSTLYLWVEIMILMDQLKDKLYYIGLTIVLSIFTLTVSYYFRKILTRLNLYYELSHKDFLTNLYNDRYLSTHMHSLMKWNKKEYCYLLIDVNELKKINDLYGHRYGDQALVLVANQLKKVFVNGIIFRKSGDEFVILYEGDGQHVMEITEEFIHNLANQVIKVDNLKVEVVVSIGIVAVNKEMNENDLFAVADRALYEAKNNDNKRIVLVR